MCLPTREPVNEDFSYEVNYQINLFESEGEDQKVFFEEGGIFWEGIRRPLIFKIEILLQEGGSIYRKEGMHPSSSPLSISEFKTLSPRGVPIFPSNTPQGNFKSWLWKIPIEPVNPCIG